MRVLLVEDDRQISHALGEAMRAAGWTVDHARDGEDAWFRGDTETYSAVVLDLGLPGLDGLTVLRRWRKSGRTMPVLILSARGTWSERVEGIDLGADDYIAKPFAMEEVLARLRALVRRASSRSACARGSSRCCAMKACPRPSSTTRSCACGVCCEGVTIGMAAARGSSTAVKVCSEELR